MIRLDFARAAPLSVQTLRWGLFSAGFAAAIGTFMLSEELQRRLEALDWKQEVSAASAQRSLASERREAAGAEPGSQVREVMRELRVDWRGVFAAIERSVTPQIRIMSVRPDPQRKLLVIQAKATNAEQALRFVERLQTDGTITDAHLVHEARDAGDDSDGLLDFSISAHWMVKS